MKFGSLFSGIGGFDLGLEQSDMICAWQVEIESNCQKLLGVKFPNAKRSSDVRHANRTNLETVDVICGGFPCQDLSVAGRRAGLAGERSGLWFEFHRVVKEIKPSWVIVENVPGLLSSNEGRDFAVILRGLVECGYGVCWRILDARYFGVAQRRRRVFIVASLNSGRCAKVLFESEGVSGNIAASAEAGQGATAYAIRRAQTGSNGWGIRENETGTLDRTGGDAICQVAGTLSANRGGLDRPAGNANELDFCVLVSKALTSKNQRNDYETENLIAFDYCVQGSERTQIARTGGEYAQLQANRPDAIAQQQMGVRRLTPVECERLQNFPDGWTSGFADSTRYRMLGNAVCVAVARWIGKRIVEVESLQ